MLDYAALTALAAVIREGSFERAATALGVTPSAVSQRVRLLEERLGAILVIRQQPCVATPTGERLCAHVERVRLLEADVVEDLPAPRLSTPTTVRVAVNADSLNTWFPKAAADFAGSSGALLDIVLDDEEHTAERLRSGDVLAAITTDPAPVQGCRTLPLGTVVYAATASPAFMRRHFADGVDAAAIARAPVLRFDRRDMLQARWARDAAGVAHLAAPTHWVPATQGFLDTVLAGLGWGMQPLTLIGAHLADGRLVELKPRHRLTVDLHWQYARLEARLLGGLTEAVRRAATAALEAPIDGRTPHRSALT